jgi:electron transfer flavoprotein alpha subunit
LVLAKQIPDVDKVSFNPETERIVREGVPLMINSFDKKAVEEAIRIKEKTGAETIVASMGPPSAADMLNECLRMGIDRAYLLTDRNFGGSDTLATSTILSEFIRKVSPDLVLAGKYSLDGETSQVPPEIAATLKWSFKSSVSRIEISQDERSVAIEHEDENGLTDMMFTLPAIFSVSEKINRARAIKPETPDMRELIVTMNASDIGLQKTGSELSPTVVTGTSGMESSRKCELLEFNGDVFKKIMRIIENERIGIAIEERIELTPQDGTSDAILGIGFNNITISMEIATRISELAVEGHLKGWMLSNLDLDNSGRLPCHEYFHVATKDTLVFSNTLLKFIQDRKPRYVVFSSTVAGREIAGRIAGKLKLGLTADCVDIKLENGHMMQYKPAFGGSIIASIYSRTQPEMATVRQGMFRRKIGTITPVITHIKPDLSATETITGSRPVASSFKPLWESGIVIGVGRGMKKRGQVEDVLGLANLLDASVGATRPIVDMGFIPRQQQIGLTGTSISPAVYIAVGVSGMANHVVGIRYCRKVIAVNSDPHAPIFRYADYGIICDFEDFIHGFTEYLSKPKN